MLEKERRDTILRLLDVQTYVRIRDIVEATGASEATIRRDLVQMTDEKWIRRLRGGIERVENPDEPRRNGAELPLDRRKVINREKKRRIARKACSFISPADVVMIDGGSTTFHMVEFLISFPLQVITTSFAIAAYLIKHTKCKVIIPEGTIDTGSELILSNISADPFANYSASRAFMGIQGITESALTNSDPLIIRAKRSMLQHSNEVTILADETKFGKVASYTVCAVNEIARIITTVDADAALVALLRSKGVEIIQV
ncbi:MAG TPA: DeoR/GlpR family DNA-binding transcription regulator [Spirochaetia bacterium]|nr:DeoR/GlpR family DNA-binding transcription regulator [Spirochaetia bacterium]